MRQLDNLVGQGEVCGGVRRSQHARQGQDSVGERRGWEGGRRAGKVAGGGEWRLTNLVAQVDAARESKMSVPSIEGCLVNRVYLVNSEIELLSF